MTLIRTACVLLVSSLVGCAAGGHPGQSDDSPPPSSGSSSFGTGGSGVAGPLIDAGTYSEPLVVAKLPPPPVSGGTLLVIAQGHKAAVADPDHDQVLIVDLDASSLLATVPLQPGDEPGRLIEDGAGRVHVSLRSGGAVVTIDPAQGTVLRRDAVCGYPRGLAYDSKADAVVIACAGGELVTLPAGGGAATRSIRLAGADGRVVRDLRDVVVEGDRLLVSRFRAAELLVVEPNGSISATLRPRPQDPSFSAAVAWRTLAAPGGGVIMVHQEEQNTEVPIDQPGGYGGFCGSIVRAAVSVIKTDGSTWSTPINSVLPVDMALTDAPNPTLHIVSARTRSTAGPAGLDPSQEFPVQSMPAPLVEPPASGNVDRDAGLPCIRQGGGGTNFIPVGQVVAVAPGPDGNALIQTREPAALLVNGVPVSFPGASRKDTGHELFHFGTMGGLACASCHPEGHEDGHVWTFSGLGPRRTQAIGGGILGTEPFHWGGDMKDFSTLAHDVFNGRMTGPNLEDKYVTALATWIDTIAAWKSSAPLDAAAVERGRVIFNSPATACTTCHAGAKMTNNTNADVGTGGPFQVPSLRGLVWRAPFMHDGCAATVGDRFSTCGGSKHGQTSSLDPGQKADLVAYLETL